MAGDSNDVVVAHVWSDRLGEFGGSVALAGFECLAVRCVPAFVVLGAEHADPLGERTVGCAGDPAVAGPSAWECRQA